MATLTGMTKAPFSGDTTQSAMNITNNAVYAGTRWIYGRDGVASRLEIGADGYLRSFNAASGVAGATIVWGVAYPSSYDFVRKTGDTILGYLDIQRASALGYALTVEGNTYLTGTFGVTGDTTIYGTTTLSGNVVTNSGTFTTTGQFTTSASRISINRTGTTEYHMFNQGGIAEWVMRQPVAATSSDFLISKLVGGVYTDYMRIGYTGTTTFAGPVTAYGAINNTTGGASITGDITSSSRVFASGNTAIGSHPYYGTTYTSIWNEYVRTSLDGAAYGLLIGNDRNTHLNAASGGSLYLRIANADKIVMNSTNTAVTGTLSTTSSLTVGNGYVTFAGSGAGVIQATSNFHVDPPAGGKVYLGWYTGTGTIIGNGAQTYGQLLCAQVVAYGGGASTKNYVIDDVVTYRNANTNTGVIYLNGGVSRYLYFDGVNYTLPGSSLYVNGVAYSSSETVKKNIRELPRTPRAVARKLKPKMFNFKEDGEEIQTRIGFIAEEIRDILGEHSAINTPMKGANGEELSPLGYDPVTLIAHLFHRVEDLEDEVEALMAPKPKRQSRQKKEG